MGTLAVETKPLVICLRKNLNVLVAHVDPFEQSSSPLERNIKWPKTGGSSYCYYREYPVVFGQKQEIVGVGQSDTANNTLYRYCF